MEFNSKICYILLLVILSIFTTATNAGGDKCELLIINSSPNNISPLPVCELCLNGITRVPCVCPPNTSKFMSFELPQWYCCTTSV
ncbi:unnamed protein product [Chironomus riparius]|uniref:Uncharacterized protein n=1 Tax=Chironomus riparius TaxID=315576 RepID=A0A9N9S9K9_9DIPT|nr:unnamed protein product [Chironomus riparius]